MAVALAPCNSAAPGRPVSRRGGERRGGRSMAAQPVHIRRARPPRSAFSPVIGPHWGLPQRAGRRMRCTMSKARPGRRHVAWAHGSRAVTGVGRCQTDLSAAILWERHLARARPGALEATKGAAARCRSPRCDYGMSHASTALVEASLSREAAAPGALAPPASGARPCRAGRHALAGDGRAVVGCPMQLPPRFFLPEAASTAPPSARIVGRPAARAGRTRRPLRQARPRARPSPRPRGELHPCSPGRRG